MKFNEHVNKIKTYEAGKPIELVVREFGIKPQDIIKLASNENPFGCSKIVQNAVQKILPNMSLYPDDSMLKLKNKLSKKFNINNDCLIIGAGSDQIIEFVIQAKSSKNSKILINSVTFAMYEVYASYVDAKVIKTSSMKHNLDEFYALYKEHNPEIIFLCTPNNPTGDAIQADKLMAFLQKIDSNTLVVIDGAYMEYAKYKSDSKEIIPKELIEKFDNVLYLGTFSKAYGLGGMRVGYGVSSPQIIHMLYKLRPPFNITTLSLEAASTSLEDMEFVESSLLSNLTQMKRYEKFAKSNNLKITNSYTNFVTFLLEDKQNSKDLSYSLLKEGMIVRDLSGYGLNAIRVTVGTPLQNDIFFELISKFL